MTLEEKISLLGYNSKAIQRLNIPVYNWWNDVLHGVARAGKATVYPQAIGMAASFNNALLQEVASTISTEARAKYNLFTAQGGTCTTWGLPFGRRTLIYSLTHGGAVAGRPTVKILISPQQQQPLSKDYRVTIRVISRRRLVSTILPCTAARKKGVIRPRQFYLQYPDIDRMPLKELKSFQRITVQSGGKQTIQFAIPVQELQKWDTGQRKWKLYPGRNTILVGSSSEDRRLILSNPY